jgi:hypothetical protein
VRGRAQVAKEVCEQLPQVIDSSGSPPVCRQKASIGREQRRGTFDIQCVESCEQLGDWRLVNQTAIVLAPLNYSGMSGRPSPPSVRSSPATALAHARAPAETASSSRVVICAAGDC